MAVYLMSTALLVRVQLGRGLCPVGSRVRVLTRQLPFGRACPNAAQVMVSGLQGRGATMLHATVNECLLPASFPFVIKTLNCTIKTGQTVTKGHRTEIQ